LPFAKSKDILLQLAAGFDGTDRTYLEAWGTGCTGKEAEVYSELARTADNRNPLAWTPAYAKLVWRLTPEAAAPQFAARARAESLTEAERLAAVTAHWLHTDKGGCRRPDRPRGQSQGPRAAAGALVDHQLSRTSAGESFISTRC
jgi:hypothetical protein